MKNLRRKNARMIQVRKQKSGLKNYRKKYCRFGRANIYDFNRQTIISIATFNNRLFLSQISKM